jgi:hypothetical protein
MTLLVIGLLTSDATSIADATPGRAADRAFGARVPSAHGLSGALRRTVAQSHHLMRLDEPLALAAGHGAVHRAPQLLIRLLAPLQDPYHVLQFDAWSGPEGGAFDSVTFQYDSDSNFNQTYVWYHRAPATVVRVSGRTRHAHLAIDSNLATVDMSFTPTRDTHRRTFGCDTFLAPEASTVTWTIGRLNGTFDFTPHEGYLQSHSTSVRAAVERIVPTGQHCPHPGFSHCYRQWSFDVWNGDTSISAWKSRPWADEAEINAIRFRGGTTNWEWQWIWGSLLDNDPVVRAGNQVTYDFSDAGPFLSGRMTLERTNSLEPRHGFGCDIARDTYAWSSGSLTLQPDSGPVTLTGTRLHARSWSFKPPAS